MADKKTYTTEIVLTVPAGRYCETRRYQCRFLIGMVNHPGSYCFLIPESGWEIWQRPLKHPKCPSLHQLPVQMKGETLAAWERARKIRDLFKGE